uniref:Uncharacterized protein n=1 Tax=Anopheles atroparvus TaxID=41427 RepID=A0A182IR72_ANOAO
MGIGCLRWRDANQLNMSYSERELYGSQRAVPTLSASPSFRRSLSMSIPPDVVSPLYPARSLVKHTSCFFVSNIDEEIVMSDCSRLDADTIQLDCAACCSDPIGTVEAVVAADGDVAADRNSSFNSATMRSVSAAHSASVSSVCWLGDVTPLSPPSPVPIDSCPSASISCVSASSECFSSSMRCVAVSSSCCASICIISAVGVNGCCISDAGFNCMPGDPDESGDCMPAAWVLLFPSIVDDDIVLLLPVVCCIGFTTFVGIFE